MNIIMFKIDFNANIRSYKALVFIALPLLVTDVISVEKKMTFSEITKVFQKEKSVNNIGNAIQKALTTHPEILFQKVERDASRHRITQSVGNFLPNLNLRSGVGKEYVRQSFVGANAGSVGRLSLPVRASSNQFRSDHSIRLTQKLFDGFNTPYDIKKSKQEFFRSSKNVEEAQILIAFDVFDRYISVRRFERLLRLANQNVHVHQSILKKIIKLVKGGEATTADEQSVRARLFDAKAAVGDIQGDLQTAYANFKETTGVEARKLQAPTFNEKLIPETVMEALKIAQKQNRSVVVARSSQKVTQSEFNKSASPFMPSIDLEIEAKKSFNVGGKRGYETNVSGQLVTTFNISNGGKDIGRRRELRSKMAAAKYRTQLEVRRAEKETRVSYTEMMSAHQQSKFLRKAVNSKQSVRNIYMKQFQAGSRSFIDILDASHDYFLAKGSLITVDALGDLASARVLASMGTLLLMFETINQPQDNFQG